MRMPKNFYVEALKYNDFTELHNDAQLLKTILNAGACYPRLMKENKLKNDGIPQRLLSFSYKLLVE